MQRPRHTSRSLFVLPSLATRSRGVSARGNPRGKFQRHLPIQESRADCVNTRGKSRWLIPISRDATSYGFPPLFRPPFPFLLPSLPLLFSSSPLVPPSRRTGGQPLYGPPQGTFPASTGTGKFGFGRSPDPHLPASTGTGTTGIRITRSSPNPHRPHLPHMLRRLMGLSNNAVDWALRMFGDCEGIIDY